MSEKLVIEVVLTKLTEAESKKAFENVEEQAGKSGKKAGKSFSQKFGKAFKSQLGSIVSGAAAVLALGKAFRTLSDNISSGVREVRNFERSVAEVNSILPRNQKLTQDSIDTFRDFAGTFATDTAKQAQAFYNIVSAGVKGTANQLKTLEISNKAAVAGLVDIDTAAKALVSSVNAYSASGLTATQASDALFIAVREGQTTFGELSANIGTVAPVAASAGLKFEELAGAISGVTKAGIRTDIAITGIRALLSSLIKVTPQAADQAKRLGLEFSTAALRTKGFVKFLEDLREKTKGNEVALGKLFPNVRALGPILQVVNGDFDDFRRIQGEVANAVGATAEAAKILQGSLDFKLAQASANFKILRQEIVNFFTPALGELAEKITGFLVLNRSTSSEVSKLRVRIKDTKDELSDWAKIMREQGVVALQSFSSNATFAQKKAFVLQERIQELTRKLNDFGEAARIKESPFEQLLQKQRELIDLEEALTRVNMKLGDIQGRSDVVILDQITEKKREIDSLLESISKLNTSLDDSANKSIATGEKLLTSTDSVIEYWNGISFVLEDLSGKTKKSSDKIKAQINAVSNVFKQSLAKGISGGIQNIVNSIGKGEDAFANFSKFFLQTIGDMAVKLGETLILSGIGIKALQGLGPSAAIAAGAGLVALGTIIKNAAGGGGSESGGGSGGGGNSLPIEDGGAAEIDDEEFERQTSSQINITVEGSLVQQEELGQFIAEVQSEINQKNGAVIVNPRFA